MAAKKTKTTPKATKKATKKRTSRKTKAAPAKAPSTRSRSPKSVDSILKSYEKERVSQQTQLTVVQKKIKDLTTKVNAYEKEIVLLKKKQLDTENAICTLHTRRDQEVGSALAKLGINLDSAAAAIENSGKKKVEKSTPLFDKPENKIDQSKAGDKKTELAKVESK